MQLCIPHNLLVIGAEVLWCICHRASLVGHSLLHTLLGEPLQKTLLNENQSRSSSWYPMLITRSMMRAGEWRRWTVSSDANGNTCLCSHIQWAWSSGRQGTAADNVQLPHCILFNGSSVTSCQHKSLHTMLSFAKRSGMNVRLRLTTWHPINNTLGMLTYSDRKQFWAFVNLGSVWVCVGAASVWQLGNHLGTATSNQPPRRSVPTHS